MNAWIIIGCVIAVLILLCFLLAIANHSGERFMDKYKEMMKIPAETRFNTLEYIDLIAKKYFKKNIEIVKISKTAGDGYANGKLFLNDDTIYKNSLASFTIISHELGHALQDQEGRKLKKLNFFRRLGRVLGALMMPCLIAGIILMFFENLLIAGICLTTFSIFVFLLAILIKIATISIEKDASKKAEVFLKEILSPIQTKKCKKFLNDARLTYWAEFLRILLFWTGFSKKTKLFN